MLLHAFLQTHNTKHHLWAPEFYCTNMTKGTGAINLEKSIKRLPKLRLQWQLWGGFL